MNSQDDASFGGAMLFGGAILAVALGAMFLRGLQAMLVQLGKTFDAFATMAHSLFGMLFWFGLFIVTLGAIVATLFSAFYFAKKYVELIKSGLELREAFQSKTLELNHSLGEFRHEVREEMDSRLSRMENRLAAALREPEVSPEVKEISVQPETLSSGLHRIEQSNEIQEVVSAEQSEEGLEDSDSGPEQMTQF